jgi:hypothetical protein
MSTKVLKWIFGAVAGLSLMVAGLTATTLDLTPQESEPAVSAGITATAAD